VSWPTATLGDCGEIQGGLQVTSKRKSLPLCRPYLRVANVHRGQLDLTEIKAIRTTQAEADRTRLHSGDLLFVEGHANPHEVGRVAVWDGSVPNCVHQNHLIRVRLDPSVLLPAFAVAWFNSPAGASHFRRASKTTSGLNTISANTVRSAPTPLPPLDEQRRIAAILDMAHALRDRRRQVGSQLESLARSLFFDMFGDPAVTNGPYPASRLVEWIDPNRPITYGILKPGPDIEDGVPYVRVADMKEGGIDTAGVRRSTKTIADQYRRSTLRSGDLLMSIRGHVGRFAFVPEELDGANITQDSARLAVSDPISAVYVRAAMEMPGLQQWMTRHTKGAAVRGINRGDIKEMPIPCPPMPLQAKFAAAVGQTDKQRRNAKVQLMLMEEAFLALQSRAFSGQL
jgi:type I restriction enzyme S subunit